MHHGRVAFHHVDARCRAIFTRAHHHDNDAGNYAPGVARIAVGRCASLRRYVATLRSPSARCIKLASAACSRLRVGSFAGVVVAVPRQFQPTMEKAWTHDEDWPPEDSIAPEHVAQLNVEAVDGAHAVPQPRAAPATPFSAAMDTPPPKRSKSAGETVGESELFGSPL